MFIFGTVRVYSVVNVATAICIWPDCLIQPYFWCNSCFWLVVNFIATSLTLLRIASARILIGKPAYYGYGWFTAMMGFSCTGSCKKMHLISGLPSRTILDQTYSAQRFFIFSYFLFFYFGSCGRLSWLNCQISSAR